MEVKPTVNAAISSNFASALTDITNKDNANKQKKKSLMTLEEAASLIPIIINNNSIKLVLEKRNSSYFPSTNSNKISTTKKIGHTDSLCRSNSVDNYEIENSDSDSTASPKEFKTLMDKENRQLTTESGIFQKLQKIKCQPKTKTIVKSCEIKNTIKMIKSNQDSLKASGLSFFESKRLSSAAINENDQSNENLFSEEFDIDEQDLFQEFSQSSRNVIKNSIQSKFLPSESKSNLLPNISSYSKPDVNKLASTVREDIWAEYLEPTPNFECSSNKRKNLNDENNSKLIKLNDGVGKINNSLNTTLRTNNTQLLENICCDKISAFFDNIELSICQLGTSENDVPTLDSLFGHSNSENVNSSLNTQHHTECPDWADDSFTNTLINKLESNEDNLAVFIRKQLVSNASKLPNISPVTKTFITRGPFYGLPKKVEDLVKLHKGIEKLYDWQHECLTMPAIQSHRNLIYALPTSGGKTLVAEILMLREMLCRNHNVLFVLPYVAIVQEKVSALAPFAVALDFIIEEYAASKGSCPPKKHRNRRSLYIATIEKALRLINSLEETNRLDEIGLVIVDELHLIGEQQRGPTLETFLTKVMFFKKNLQIIGMSATIGNLEEISKFLCADIYTQNFRPVELVEYIKCGNEIAKVNYGTKAEQLLTFDRKVSYKDSHKPALIDPDCLGVLVMEIIPSGSCLIFCASKKNCENVVFVLCKILPHDLKNYKRDEKRTLLNALEEAGTAPSDTLTLSVLFGVAYHHAGLTSDERKLIEDGFRAGIISVICCTSTLAAGVNLPAKRVIVRQPYIGRHFINLARYKQMVGRAGRTGLGETGDSILVCNIKELPKIADLLRSPMDEALSNMHIANSQGLRGLFLSCIGLGTVSTRAELRNIARTTLLAVQQERLNININKLTDEVITNLYQLRAFEIPDSLHKDSYESISIMDNLCIHVDDKSSTAISNDKTNHITIKNDTKIIISKLGRAAIKGGLDLTKADILYNDLMQAQKQFILVDCLHLLYLITPYDLAEQIKPIPFQYYTILSQINENEQYMANILGIDESCARRMFTNEPIKDVQEHVLNRFYATLMLNNLYKGMSIFEVANKYKINRGIVQNVITSATSFAYNVINFCEEMDEFWPFTILLKGISKKLESVCVQELAGLTELSGIKQGRAKQLYNAGYKTLQSIAKADPSDLVKNIKFLPNKVAIQLIAAAKLKLLEKVAILREEVEKVFAET